MLDYVPTVGRTLEYLSIQAPDDLALPPPRLNKQGDALSEEWTHLDYREEYRYQVHQTVLNFPSVIAQPSLRRAYLGPALRRWSGHLVAQVRPGKQHCTTDYGYTSWFT